MAVCDTYVFPGFLTQVLTRISFQSHQILFSHASAEVRGKNMRERNIASTGSQTHNHHKVMSLTHSPLSHPGWTQEHSSEFCLKSSEWFQKRGLFFFKDSAICHTLATTKRHFSQWIKMVSALKTLYEKEKVLLTSNLSFSPQGF